MRAVALVLLAGCVAAEAEVSTVESEVIGGSNAPAGKWPDVAAVLFDGQQGCTGTLIAPTVVLTAGHCNSADLDSVLVGTWSLGKPSEGETLAVAKRVEYESSPGAGDALETEDLTVLVLATASKFEPRAIATGWARFDIVDGAQVTIAGYGAVDENSTRYKNELQEAITTITDADCTDKPGCNAAVMPGGELGAGGMGIDTCPGDSGGPLYLMTEYGNFLAGATSRAYDDATTDCKDGGIYARPDKVIDWIEASAGVPVARAPEPRAEPIVVVRGRGAETQIDHRDPKSDQHVFEIVTPPAAGMAKVRDDGRVRVCASDTIGNDTVAVKVTDAADAARSITLAIPITVTDGEADGACNVDDFEDTDGGCCDSGRGGASSLLAAGVLGLALRRRRRR